MRKIKEELIRFGFSGFDYIDSIINKNNSLEDKFLLTKEMFNINVEDLKYKHINIDKVLYRARKGYIK